MTIELHLLSAGAAKGLCAAGEALLRDECGAALCGEFGAVGAIRETLLGGAPCDVIVLTAAMLADLARDGLVAPDTVGAIGRVRTGIAVRSGDLLPAIADRNALANTLSGAAGLYVPDLERSTAGQHFAGVLRALGIADAVRPRTHAFANGAAAMHALATSSDAGGIGCTQVTEIRYTPGVTLVGPLPVEFELATMYAVAVCTSAPHRIVARRFAQWLGGPESLALRREGGFEA